MIKVLESNSLNDSFIDINFISNISINDRLTFNKKDIYYFGNYNEMELYKIKEKLIKNKKNIKNAVEKGIKFIICGNSCEIFNNNFNINDINLFTQYNNNNFKYHHNKLKFKKRKKENKIKTIYNLNDTITTSNFKYKNLIFIENEKYIYNTIKKIQNN